MFTKQENTEFLLKSLVLLTQITITLLTIPLIYELYRGSSVVNIYLFIEKGWSYESISILEIVFCVILLLSLTGVWLHIRISGMVISVIIIAVAVVSYLNGGKLHHDLKLISSIIRGVFPVIFWWVLPLVQYKSYSDEMKYKADNLLMIKRFALVSTSLIFLTHGFLCLKGYPLFLDYLIGSIATILGIYIEQSSAEFMVMTIGIIDILGGILLWITQDKRLLYWLFIWAVLTTSIRILEGGFGNWQEAIIRTPHITLPLVLILIHIQGQYRSVQT